MVHIVSGKKYGREKIWYFKTQKEAMKKYNEVKFKRGWKDLGVSEYGA